MARTAVSPSGHTTFDPRSTLTGAVQAEVGCSLLVLKGDVDLATWAVLADLLSAAIAAAGSKVIIDLAEVEFIDGASMRSLIAARDVLRQRGRRLIVRSPSRVAARVLSVLGASDLVERPTSMVPSTGGA